MIKVKAGMRSKVSLGQFRLMYEVFFYRRKVEYDRLDFQIGQGEFIIEFQWIYFFFIMFDVCVVLSFEDLLKFLCYFLRCFYISKLI